MKNLFKLASVVIATTAIGCGRSTYPVKSYNLSQTQVVLSQKNFRMTGKVSGSSPAGYLLGVIGGLLIRQSE